MHGHVEALLREHVDAIFYPCMTYNLDEGLGTITTTVLWWHTIRRSLKPT